MKNENQQAQRTTTHGTPCSPRWSDAWIDAVETVETQLNRRICGAIALDGTPCRLSSTSLTGRCRFHGGGNGVGAPRGNSNALIHGLYSRRLARCRRECPMWNYCPYANADVENLDAKHRPHCHYERAEYNRLLELLFNATPDPEGNPEAIEVPPVDESMHTILLHQFILAQILLSRASAMLAITNLATGGDTHSTVVNADADRSESSADTDSGAATPATVPSRTIKQHPALLATQRFMSESRSLYKMITGKKPPEPAKSANQPMDIYALAMKTKGAGEEIEAEMKRRGIPLKDDPREKGGWPPDDPTT